MSAGKRSGKKRLMRIALLQKNLTVGALDANCYALARGAGRARDLGADVAIASELSVLGYPPRDLLERPAFVQAVLSANEKLVRAIPEGIVLCFGTIDEKTSGEGRPLHNAVLVARHGELLARAHKRLLPTYDVFDEDRYFEPGDRARAALLAFGSLGITICEDAWNDVSL